MAERDELLLHYQPRASLSSGAVIGAEALLCWPRGERGSIPPGRLPPRAEGSGRAGEIGGAMLADACREAAGWPGGGIVSVNVSARQLAETALLGQVAQALGLSGLDPERLEIELTESILLDESLDLFLVLAALRDLGVSIALDGFGAGLASLTLLKRLPLCAIKLDRSWVRDLPWRAEDATIVHMMIATAHVLGMRVIGEGIETEAQRAFLAAAGCDAAEGCLFGRPLAAEQHRARLQIAGSAGLGQL